MDMSGKVMRPAETRSSVHKENHDTSKGTSGYDAVPENDISSRDDTHVEQLPASVHCSDYLQQTLSDLMQLNPDDFIIHGDQLRQFSHRVLQDTSSESVTDVVSASSNVGSNLKETTDGSCSSDNLQPADTRGENVDANDIYYSHIYDCIVSDTYPEGYSMSYHKALKKRARHYCVINGTLYYNNKQPREVIIKKHLQQKILQNAHIENGTGIHLGAKRMHETIKKAYFWRGMYMDITTFVRDCHICSESFTGHHFQSSTQCRCGKTDENDNDDDLFVNNGNPLDTDLEFRNRVWQKVLVKVCGPYPKTADDNEYLITIVDPVSMWVCVKPTTSEKNIKIVATFIIKIFYLLGFAECCFIGFTTQELENVQTHYEEGIFESEISSCMFAKERQKRSEREEHFIQHGADECSWSTNLLNDFVSCYPSDWDRKIQSFLHTYHLSIGHDKLSPFYKLHGRNPKFSMMENKENATKDTPCKKSAAVLATKGNSQNFELQCQQCNKLFTSKISYQIHQKNHVEGAEQCDTLGRDDCPLFHRKFRRKICVQDRQDNAASSVQTGTAPSAERRAYLANKNQQQKMMKLSQPSEIRANAIACVKKLLESAREKQRKRGKYHKYSPEIREQIALCVAEKGAGEAARCFSEKLGRVVSESTVRNIFKLHSSYTPELKEEIGKYAMIYGVKAASDHFTQKLGHAVRLGIVHKFKRFYLSQIPTQLKKKIHKKRSNVSRKRHYSDELKEEIGSYAFKYTVGAAIQYYSRKFGYPITETVVRRFRKMYLQKTFEQQAHWKQKQEHLSVQQKGKEQQQTCLDSQESSLRHQMQQAFPQNHINNTCAPNTDTASVMQTINILHSSMGVLNDPQFRDSPDAMFSTPCEAAALSSNCTSFDQHTNSVLDIQPYIHCSDSIVSSSLVFPNQFNNVVDSAQVSTDPSIPVQEYQHNELYSYFSEHGQQEDSNSVTGNNYNSSLQLPPLSHFTDAELDNKAISALDGTAASSKKQQSFHLPSSSNFVTDRLVSQIHSVLSNPGDVLFQQECIQHLNQSNATIQLNTDKPAEQNTDDTTLTSRHSSALHTNPICFAVNHVSAKGSTEYISNTLFEDQTNSFLLPSSRADCNVSTYNKYDEIKEPNIPSAQVNSTNLSSFISSVRSPVSDSEAMNGHSYSVQSPPNSMCSLPLQSLEPVVTNVLQIHETTTTSNTSPAIISLGSQDSEQQLPLSFVTSSTNASVTENMLKTSTTPSASVEYVGKHHSHQVINMTSMTSDPSALPADVPQNFVTSLSSSLLGGKQVTTSCTTYPSCSVSVLKGTMASCTNHPFLVQTPINQATPLYTVATTASRTTKSVGCAYAITLAQEEKKEVKIPLVYFSQSQITEPPPLVAISQSKISVEQSSSHMTVLPVTSVTQTFCTMDPIFKIPPLAALSHGTPRPLNEPSPLQNSVITDWSHSSRKRSTAYRFDTVRGDSQHEKLESLDQSTANQSKLSGSDSKVCPVDKTIILSVESNSNIDRVKNKSNSVWKKPVLLADASSSLHSVNNVVITQNRATVSHLASSLVVPHQMTPVSEVAVKHVVVAQTKPNHVENIPLNTSVSSSVKDINSLTAKKNLSRPTFSVPLVVHPKTVTSSKLTNLSVTDTRPSPASIVSVQALMAVSDLKQTAETTSTNSCVTVMSSQTATVNKLKMSTALVSSKPITTAQVSCTPVSTAGNVQSHREEIPVIEYCNKQKQAMQNRSESITNLKQLATCKSKDEIHDLIVTLPTIHSVNSITVTSSNTPVMNHKLTVSCSSTASNCTSTGDCHFTSSSLATTKSRSSSLCYKSPIHSSSSSQNGVSRKPSSNSLSSDVITVSSSNALATPTAVTTFLSNCSPSRSTSLDYLIKISATNTSTSPTTTSSAVQTLLETVPEVCSSSAVGNHSGPTSNSKNSASFTDATFSYNSETSLCNTMASCMNIIYSSNISSNSNATSLSANNDSLKSTARVSPSNDFSTGLVMVATDSTKGDKKPNSITFKNSHKKSLSRKKGCKRGNYFAYSPELRAEMGKYAADHGSQQACLYFKRVLGVEIPSSTMRTLRDKYLLKLEHCTFDQKAVNKEVTSLGYGQRGRPMRLGKYDEEVHQCIQEIVKTGEPVTSYLVIETARQVLMQYDPSLLEENGGNIKLNVSWAKSFLKRTGVRNNS